MVTVDGMVKDVRTATPSGAGPRGAAGGSRASDIGVAHGPLADQLDLVARCIEARVVTRVFSASLTGFDTHADEKGLPRQLVTQLDAAVSAFVARMARSDAGRRTVVAIYSEFGRRVR